MAPYSPTRLIQRDLSWLAFNHRVLQEAMDPAVPPFDRLGFLAIYSSNLDEFFRVRVAALRSQLRHRGGGEPADLLPRIHATVVEQQTLFGEILRDHLLPELARHGVRLVDETRVTEEQRARLRELFAELVAPHLAPVVLDGGTRPFLKNRGIYLVAELVPEAGGEATYGLVEVPGGRAPRFVALPGGAGEEHVLFLDDMVRLHLPELFPGYRVGAAHSVKLSRDAELYLEEELAGSVAEAVRHSLPKRETGTPSRFLFDQGAPGGMIRHLKSYFGLAGADLVAGGRYHNLHDLHSFPRGGRADLAAAPLAPLPHAGLESAASVFEAVARRDRIVHLPYQSYDHVLRFLREAASDPRAEAIWITLYRVAPRSAVVDALVEAARAGKRVTAFVEVQARFDEATNLECAERLESAGVRTVYSMPGLKVHAKLALVSVREGAGRRLFACLATGNFNERTARIYADHALLTAHPEITAEVRELFRYLCGEAPVPAFRHLLVAPFTLRQGLQGLVQREIDAARAGGIGRMVLKMNSLEDAEMVDWLYRASEAGVRTDLVVRGICCLAAGVPGLSENVAARSLVDRFLEHARVFLFHAGGAEECYLASADWMQRNLSRRVEVAFPLLDDEVRAEVKAMLRLQLADNRKSRVLDPELRNPHLVAPGAPAVRAQMDTYRLLQSLAQGAPAPPRSRAEALAPLP